MILKKVFLFLLGAIFLEGHAWGIGPHEVLVLVNDKSPKSIEIADEFVRLRSIPEANVVRLSLPAYVDAKSVEISSDDFTQTIWTPTLKAVRVRGIGDHILAWVYSVDFPTTVSTSPKMSLQGITFLRNAPIAPEKVEKGTYPSALFSGPNPVLRGTEMYASQTFDTFAEWLNDDMPLPSMMLGYTGERGNSKDTVLKCLRSGAASDGTWPTGTVFFVISEDVRSRCRQWQFASVGKELVRQGIRVEVTGTFPSARSGIIGLMMGAADVDPGKDNRYLPGSMAEHLTSAAGDFQSPGQTKMSVWIEAGAAGTAGTVVEPMSAWPKFPGARFFVHYANGCSLMESFFQSIRCPLQILLIGEPLARPWATTNVALEVKGLNDESVSGILSLRAEVKSMPGQNYRRFLYLLDGRTIGRERELSLDVSKIGAGNHKLRAVAYSTGLVKNQVFVEKTILVGNDGKKATP